MAYSKEIGWTYVPRGSRAAAQVLIRRGATPEEREKVLYSLVICCIHRSEPLIRNTKKPRVRWSVSSSGMDRAVGDYVIVHELLHFAVPHHGKLWKSLMRAHLGDYEILDQKLKQGARTAGSNRSTIRYSYLVFW